MKKTLIVTLAAVALVATTSVQAIPISGTVDMSGTVVLNNQSLGSATGALGFANVTVGGTSDGSFTGTGGASVTWSGFNFNPANTPITPLWIFNSGGRTYEFDLSNVGIVSQSNTFLNLLGSGTLKISGVGPSYEDTLGTWSFTISNSSGQPHSNFSFTFANSQTAGVPDGGTTVMLMGAALSGLGLLRRKLVA